jgi:hypothetical protein
LPRLSQRERVGRLSVSVDYLTRRLETCQAARAQNAAGAEDPELSKIQADVTGLATGLRARRVDPDVVSEGIDLVDRAVALAASRCAGNSARDRALGLIAARHDVPP